MDPKVENKRLTAEEIYEANRPKFRDWGTLKGMCIASMEQYAEHKASKVLSDTLDKVTEEDIELFVRTDIYPDHPDFEFDIDNQREEMKEHAKWTIEWLKNHLKSLKQ